ncbi:MAG: hypothetical protein QXD57_07495 [Ignisphaera sp.]
MSRLYLLIATMTVVALINTWFIIDVYGEKAPLELGRIRWRSYSNPSRGRDIPYSVCGYGDWIYIVGSEASDQDAPIPRIEKRLKSDGSLLAFWRGDVHGEFKDCVVTSDKVYAVGYVDQEWGSRTWVIAIFDTDLKPLNISIRREFMYWSEAIAITVLKDSIYVAGFVGVAPNDTQWRIERISIDLSILQTYEINPSNAYDILMCFDANPVTEKLWVVGINGLTGFWKIEILDEDLNREYTFEGDIPGYGLPNAITFDENGSAYIAGAGIAMFSDRAELTQVSTTFGYCPKLVYSNGIIYLFCTLMLEGYNRHIMYAIDKRDFIAFTFTLSRDISAYTYFTNGKLYLDEDFLYIAGFDELEDSGRWVIYSIEKIPNQIPVEYVVTEPYTSTITITISFRDLIEQIKKEISTTTALETVSPSIEIIEQKPSIDIKITLLILTFMLIASILLFLLIAKKKQ